MNGVEINEVGSARLVPILLTYQLPYMVDRRGVSNDGVSRYDGTLICDMPQHHIEEVNFLLDGETGDGFRWKLRKGDFFDFFPNDVPVNGDSLKCSSSDEVYSRFWRQLSELFTVLCSMRLHCLEALCIVHGVGNNQSKVQWMVGHRYMGRKHLMYNDERRWLLRTLSPRH